MISKKTQSPSGGAESIAAGLGASFRAVPSTKREAGLVQVEHVPSGTLFVAIPGGVFEMGITRAETSALAKLEFNEEVTREHIERLAKAKTKKVKVAPFLVARAPASERIVDLVLSKAVQASDDSSEDIARVSATTAAKLARAFAKDGLRLVTESEWEWIAREGGTTLFINAKDAKGAEKACAVLYRTPRFDRNAGPPASNGFGVWGLPWGDFVTSSIGTRRTVWGVRGGAAFSYPWQSDEIVTCVPSFGYRIGKSKEPCGVRFAIDMPKRS